MPVTAGIAAALTAKSMGLRYLVIEQEAALGGTVFHIRGERS